MEDKSHVVLGLAVFFLIATTICVGLRIYVRVGILKHFGLDDWAMSACQTLFTIYIACQLGGVRYGTGRHHWDIEREDQTKALRFWYFCEVFYILTTVMLKVAIGIFLSRIAISKIHIWIIRFIMASTTLFGTMYLFIVIFQCSPIHIFWTVTPGGPGCLNTNIIVGCTYAAGALNAIADWTFGTLPFFIVWDLKMTKKAKLLVAGILAFAAIGSMATVVRIPYSKGLGVSEDFLWTSLGVAIWSTVELGIGIIAGCVATLRPLMRNFLWKIGIGSTPASSSGPLSYGKHSRQRTPSRGLNEIQLEGVQTTCVSTNKPERHNSSWNKNRKGSDEVEVLKDGISKHVVVEYEESRPPRHNRSRAGVHDTEQDSIDGMPTHGTHWFDRT